MTSTCLYNIAEALAINSLLYNPVTAIESDCVVREFTVTPIIELTPSKVIAGM